MNEEKDQNEKIERIVQYHIVNQQIKYHDLYDGQLLSTELTSEGLEEDQKQKNYC